MHRIFSGRTITGIAARSVLLTILAALAAGAAFAAPYLNVSTNRLTFTHAYGKVPPSQGFEVRNSSDGTLNWTASATANWITVSPRSGRAPSKATVSVKSNGMPSGSHVGYVKVQGAGATRLIRVVLSIASPKLILSNEALIFNVPNSTSSAPAQGVQVTNGAGGILNWTAKPDVPWLRVTPASGPAPGAMMITTIPGAVPAGTTHVGRVVVTAPKAERSPRRIRCTVIVGEDSSTSDPNKPDEPVEDKTVSVSPSTAKVISGEEYQFSASVTGFSNKSVTWTATPGSIGPRGIFTAPVVSNTVTAIVTATSVADNKVKSTASVTVSPSTQAVGVNVVPKATVLSSGSSFRFSATVTGSSNQAVTWSASQGTIAQDGTFVAPATNKNVSVTVTATAKADTSAKDTAQASVTPASDGPQFTDDFSSGRMDKWVILDQGVQYAPSLWQVVGGVLQQNKNIRGGSNATFSLPKPGTLALAGSDSWKDYSLKVRMMSGDDDAFGIVFGYKDPNNFYRFSMDRQRKYRRLVKVVNGNFTSLAEDRGKYSRGVWNDVQANFAGGTITILLNSEPIFVVQDSSHRAGKIALYSWDHDKAYFDNVVVTPFDSSGCTYEVSPGEANHPAAGGTGSFSVVAPAGCAWSAAPSQNWVTISSGVSGAGNGTVRYVADGNTGTAERRSTINVAGELYNVIQTGKPAPPPSTTPSDPTTPPPGSSLVETNGHIEIEAEAGEIVNRGSKSWLPRTDRSGYSGTSFLHALPNTEMNNAVGYVGVSPEIRYKVRFNTPGKYYVWVRGLGDSLKNDSIHIGLNGRVNQPSAEVARFPNPRDQFGWTGRSIYDQILYVNIPSAGDHVINAWMREDGFRFDKLILTKSSSFRPAGVGNTNPPPSSSGPNLTVSPGSIAATGTAGSGSPISKFVMIDTTGSSALNWTASTNRSWIKLDTTSGSTIATFKITLNPAGLSIGTHSGNVVLVASGADNSPYTLPVSLSLSASPSNPALVVSPADLAIYAIGGGSAPAAQNLLISTTNGGQPRWTASADKSWIKLGATSGTGGSLRVSFNVSGLSAGTHNGSVNVSASGIEGSPKPIPVRLTISSSLPPSSGGGNQWFVSPAGRSSGNGSQSSPWDLQTAFDHPSVVKPGDTIWLLGGTYHGTYKSKLKGSQSKPIIVRQYPNERATIDTGTDTEYNGLEAWGSDTWFWGFEIMSSNPTRIFGGSGSRTNTHRVDGVGTFGVRNKFINLVIHDTRQGVGFWDDAIDNELYGSLIYYNGWSASDRGHGHAAYTQNRYGEKWMVDNIAFYGHGMGLRVYGSENAFGKHVRFIGNVGVNNGYLHGGPKQRWSNYLVTVGSGAEDIIFEDNHSYMDPEADDGFAQLGWRYSGREKDIRARNNYFIGGESALELWHWNDLTFTNNTLYSKGALIINFNHRGDQKKNYTFNSNKYFGSGIFRYMGHNRNWSSFRQSTGLDTNSSFAAGRPTGTWKFVRPNKYEPGRANIVIYNWDNHSSVAVDVTGVLKSGDRYEIRDAMNFYGPRVKSGVYNGQPISIPMAKRAIARPVGNVRYQPVHTLPKFGVFVLLPIK